METVTSRVEGDVEVGLKDLRAHLGQHLDLVHHRDQVVKVQRNSRPVAVLISVERYQRLLVAHLHGDSLDRVSGNDVFLTCSGDVLAG